MILRPYQFDLKAEVKAAWASGAKNVLMRLDTGGGKTAIVSDIINEHVGASAVIAHRQELVGQLSMTLALNGVYHNLIASQPVRRAIAALHMAEYGRSFFRPGSLCSVASVDTLIRAKNIEAWAHQVTKWVVDEAHHVVVDNKWHRCLELFTHPACLGLGPTATPKRADGKGLGAHADGVFHAMVQGPPMRWLIEQGWLTDYKIICPESDLQLFEEVGSTGDWSSHQLKEAAKRSHIVGDVVAAYQKFAAGKLAIVFATDVETAASMSAAYRAAGVRAETITGETDGGYRRQILKAFARREISVIVAVDIVSEGFDLPALEVAIFARPTQSLALYMQQFGRALRPLPRKEYALIIDMVANTLRHQGPPDKPRIWSLDRRDKRAGSGGGIPLRVCLGCYQPYERTLKLCPYCGAEPPPPESRSSPAAVDGDLAELDAETLARLRGEVEAVDQSLDDYRRWLTSRGVNQTIYLTRGKTHAEKQEAQATLRSAMAIFGGYRHAQGRSDSEIQREFFFRFGIDVLSAMALGRAEALELAEKVRNHV